MRWPWIGPDVAEAERLEEQAGRDEDLERLLGLVRPVQHVAGQRAEELLRPALHAPHHRRRELAREDTTRARRRSARSTSRCRSGRRRRFFCCSARRGSAPRRPCPPVMPPSPISAIAHAGLGPGAACARAMPSAAEIEVPAWPAPKGSYGDSSRRRNFAMPPSLPMRSKPSRRPGEHLVRVALVADVEDEAVARRVEDVVERGDQLDGAEARGEVAAGARRRARRSPRAAPRRRCRTCSRGSAAQVVGRLDPVQQRSLIARSLPLLPHREARELAQRLGRSPNGSSACERLGEQLPRRARARRGCRSRAPASTPRPRPRRAASSAIWNAMPTPRPKRRSRASAVALGAAEPRAADDRGCDQRRRLARVHGLDRARRRRCRARSARSSTCPPTSCTRAGGVRRDRAAPRAARRRLAALRRVGEHLEGQRRAARRPPAPPIASP